MLDDFELTIHVCLYSMIPEWQYELFAFLARPCPNIGTEGLLLSALSFSKYPYTSDLLASSGSLPSQRKHWRSDDSTQNSKVGGFAAFSS